MMHFLDTPEFKRDVAAFERGQMSIDALLSRHPQMQKAMAPFQDMARRGYTLAQIEEELRERVAAERAAVGAAQPAPDLGDQVVARLEAQRRGEAPPAPAMASPAPAAGDMGDQVVAVLEAERRAAGAP